MLNIEIRTSTMLSIVISYSFFFLKTLTISSSFLKTFYLNCGPLFSLNINEICGFHIFFITSAPPFWSFTYFQEDFARKRNDTSSCNDRL